MRERAKTLCLFKSSLFATPAFSSRFSSCSARAKFSFFSEGAFGANFFCVSSLSVSRETRVKFQHSASPLPKSPVSPPPCASKTSTHIIYTKQKMAKVRFSRLCPATMTSLFWVRASEQNTKREREWRIKYRASRVSSLFRSRARADFFVFSRRAACCCGNFRFGKRRVKRWMRTSLARLDDSNVLIYRGWMYSDRICAFSLVPSVSFGEMHFSFFPSRCRFRFADRAFIGSAD